VRYLPKLATGAGGLLRPGFNHGSDPASMITRAKPVDGGFIMKGAKMWITNSPIADVFVVGQAGRRGRQGRWSGIHPRLHPKGMKGLSAEDRR
jgi:glutaryl-CoA dehydrogenase